MQQVTVGPVLADALADRLQGDLLVAGEWKRSVPFHGFSENVARGVARFAFDEAAFREFPQKIRGVRKLGTKYSASHFATGSFDKTEEGGLFRSPGQGVPAGFGDVGCGSETDEGFRSHARARRVLTGVPGEQAVRGQLLQSGFEVPALQGLAPGECFEEFRVRIGEDAAAQGFETPGRRFQDRFPARG